MRLADGQRGRRLHAQRHLPRAAHRGHARASSSRCTWPTRTCPDGITLHWHGVDVPNAEDGVAGVTQDAVMPGHEPHLPLRRPTRPAPTGTTPTRCRTSRSSAACSGPLVVQPPDLDPPVQDVVALLHTYGGIATLNGLKLVPVEARPGQRVRLRVINTDNGPTRAWADTPFRGRRRRRSRRPRPDRRRRQGRRASPPGAGSTSRWSRRRDGSDVRVQVGAATAALVGRGTARVAHRARAEAGARPAVLRHPGPARLRPRGRRPALPLRHRPEVRLRAGQAGAVVDDQRPPVPERADVRGPRGRRRRRCGSPTTAATCTRCTCTGTTPSCSPATATKATGSPWWFDSLNVKDGETYDVAFVADNPGIWMDHCHNLQHAQQGLVTHLMYAGVTEPYRVGGDAGQRAGVARGNTAAVRSGSAV